MKLSIIIPVFNEEKTVDTLLEKLAAINFPKIEKEIIVVDDGSTDTTGKILARFVSIHAKSKMKVIKHKKNQGKGAAIKTGISKATGEYIIIQDADLEYDPHDIVNLLKPILEKKAVVVYGTRLKRLPNFSRDERTAQFLLHYLGNRFLSLVTSMLYLQWVTDMETCYKVFPKKAIENVVLRARGFEFEPEITAKLLKSGYKIYEIPINTNPRGYKEGKKLQTFKDGKKAIWALVKYRFIN